MTQEEKFSQIEALIARHFHVEYSDMPDTNVFEYTFSSDDSDDYHSWKNYFTFNIGFDDNDQTKGTLFVYESEMVHDGFSYSYGSIDGFQEENYIEPKWDTEEAFTFSSFEELLELVDEQLDERRY